MPPSVDEIRTRAQGRWRDILAHLAGLTEKQLANVHQPCPACGGTDRYRFDDRTGNGDWFCNQCGGPDQHGGGGDGFSLLMRVRRIDFRAAAREVWEYLGGDPIPPPPSDTPSKPTPILPVPDDAPDSDPLSASHPRHGRPSVVWDYRDADGRLLLHVCRFNTPEGKQVLPYSYCELPSSKRRWTWKGITGEAPRPIYGLDTLAAKPSLPVLIVEGEKCATAAQQLLSHRYAVVSWLGGTSSIRRVDWSPLTGRTVVIWPDHDTPGVRAAQTISQTLGGARILQPPADVRPGWDVADAIADGWDADQLLAFIEAPTESPTSKPQSTVKCLGYNGTRFYYLPADTDQVYELTASSHTKPNLLALADHVRYWERKYQGDYTVGANEHMRACRRAGIFIPEERIRASGCWREGDSLIMHLGDRLLVDGKTVALRDYMHSYVYERMATKQGPADTPISREDIQRICRAAHLIRWEHDTAAKLFLGWIVLAPICGWLRWRPHIWIAGSKGSGKSELLNRFVTPLLGDLAVECMSATSQAGIRQSIGAMSCPVVFDEAETHDDRSGARIQGVLEVLREASSESTARVRKGSAGGRAVAYHIRSMFALGSIVSNLRLGADKDRVTVCRLQPPKRLRRGEHDKQWDELSGILSWITPHLGGQLIRQTIDRAESILANVEVLARVAAQELGSQRYGDQYGTLLAGHWALTSDDVLDETIARSLVMACDLDPFVGAAREADDETCLGAIVQHQLRVDGEYGPLTCSVGELIAHVTGHEDERIRGLDHDGAIATRHLRRAGILVEPPWVLFANQSQELTRALRGTTWANGWMEALRAMQGAEAGPHRRFGAAGQHRCVMVPLGLVVEGE